MNVPTAPVGCATCGAVAGERCRTGLGTIAVHMHAARARAVAAWHESFARHPANRDAVIIDLTAARRRRDARNAEQLLLP